MKKANLDKINFFLKDRKKGVIALFVAVPLILVLVQLVPQLKEALILHPENPTVTSFLFNSYAHVSIRHLLNNMGAYFFVITLLLVYGAYAKDKHVYKTLVCIFLIIPPVTSALTLWFTPNLKNVVGFSGVVAALFGYLVVAFIFFLGRFYGLRTNGDLAFLFFLVNSLEIGAIYKSWKAVAVVFAGALIFISFSNTRSQVVEMRKLLDKKNIKKDRFANAFVALGLVTVLFSSSIFFPSKIVEGSSMTNISVHWLGYLLGFFIAEGIYSGEKWQKNP